MARFIVGVREVWVRSIEVEAQDESKAKDVVREDCYGEEVEVDFEYSHILDSALWTVEEKED